MALECAVSVAFQTGIEPERRLISDPRRSKCRSKAVANLLVLQGPDKGRTLTANDDVALLGRGSKQLGLTDHTVSRRHAELRRDADGWRIEDLHSANGTWLNGVRLQKPARLKHGDQIRVGGTLLVYTGDQTTEKFSGSKVPRDFVTLDAGSMDSAIVASVPSNEDSVILAAPDTAYAVKSWRAMSDLSQAIGNLLTPEQLLPRVLDIIFEEVQSERGVVFILDEETGEFLPEVVRMRRETRNDPAQASIIASRTIMQHVVESRDGVLSTNAVGDERFRSGKSVLNLGMRSVICAPIIAREQVLGIIHIDSPVNQHTYNEHELRLVTAIGYQTGLAIENSRLVQAALQRERLAAAGETVAYLSHSIKNILQGMRSGSDVMEKGLGKKDLALATQGWRILDRNLDKCYRLMLNMLAFSKDREPALELLQVNRIVDDVVKLMQSLADEKRVVLLADVDEGVPPIPADYDGLHQALLNLVANAIEAVPPSDGVVNVRTRFEPTERFVAISVADNGPGIPVEQRGKIFDAFHSTKGHGGTGLGLAVARKIAREIGGEVLLHCPNEGGAEFEIRLPTADARRDQPGDTMGGGATR
ncbi:MAG: FHA domain-containing protein [Planctomycetota bacterium]|nr:MAG: FHA domain-containing protein [Planctomycetota bacterium]